MLTHDQSVQLITVVKELLASLYDSASPVAENPSLRSQLEMPHKGFFVGLVSGSGQDLGKSGFMKDDLSNIRNSADNATRSLFNELKSKNVTLEQIKSATFHICIVQDCVYLPDPLNWNESTDGIYFMWGQKYRGMYLPYEIRRMGMSKIDILDRLCSHECSVASSLWRLPEGLVFRLACFSHSG